ncbi:MAG: PAS domain-containing protein [Myxococcales bacterium]|nr:PAS domain-containing protein [Myxococcales bacterium]
MLRDRAEALLARRDAGEPALPQDLKALLHDLSVHQIELEIQNEELRETQLLVEKARDEYARLYNQAPLGYMTLDANGMIRNANETLVQMLRTEGRALLGTPFGEHLVPADREVFNARYRAFFNAPRHKVMEVRVRQHDGGEFLARLAGQREHERLPRSGSAPPSSEPARDEAPLLVIVHDVSEMHRVTEALEAEKELLGVTLRSIGDAVIATDVEGRITLMNAAAEELTQERASEAEGKALVEVLRIANLVEEVLASRGPVGRRGTMRMPMRDGTERTFAQSGAPIHDRAGCIVGVVLIFRDTTSETHLQHELQRIAKLDSLGVMAGGIAHDFNNLLTAIAGNIGLARADLVETTRPETLTHLVDAETATMRASDLTRQLLTFATGGAPVRSVIAVAKLVQESVTLALTGSRSRCELHVPSDVWSIHADAGQISQVLHNLLLNATQAMVEGGAVVVTLTNVRLGVDAGEPLPAGDYVRIDVVDQGSGIAPEIREKIFDPFFTTKQKGSGLGLASAYSIVRNHEGHIDVESVPGRGSRFSVFLPASAKPWSKPPPPPSPATMRPWRILVLDDEPMIANVTRRILGARGHEVVTVADGSEAVASWVRQRDAGQPFDLAVLDLTIPGGMGGKEVVAHLLEVDPSTRAVASSGYSNDPVMANHRAHGFTACLPKPYTVDDLHHLITVLQSDTAS